MKNAYYCDLLLRSLAKKIDRVPKMAINNN